MYSLKCFDDKKVVLPPYIPDRLWKQVTQKLDGKPIIPKTKKRKRGRPPIHGFYCRLKPTLEDPLEVDKLAISPRMIQSERDLYLTLVRESNREAQKRRRERMIKRMKAEGVYRGPGRPKYSTKY